MIKNLKKLGESMPKALYISKGLLKSTGGAESAAFRILKGIVSSNKSKKVIILTTKPPDFLKKPSKRGFSKKSKFKRFWSKKVKFYCIPLIKLRIPIISDFLDARRFKLTIKKIIISEKIDLIHIHTYSTFYITPNSEWNIPILYTFHDFPLKWPNNPFNFFPFNFVEKTWKFVAERYWRVILSEESLRNSTMYFHCLSSEIRNFLLQKGLEKDKTRLLTNGFFNFKDKYDSDEIYSGKLKEFFNNKHNCKLKILIIGQLNNIKNQHMIIKGFEEFSEIFSESILLIAGNPTPIVGSFYLRKIWKSLKPQTKKRIVWFGHISNKHLLTAIYNFADILITMSHSEASPLILGECKKMKKPILSSSVGGLKDILPEELRVLDPNSSQSLRIKLEEIYNNKQNLVRYKEIIKSVPISSWNEIGEELIQYYSFIIDLQN